MLVGGQNAATADLLPLRADCDGEFRQRAQTVPLSFLGSYSGIFRFCRLFVHVGVGGLKLRSGDVWNRVVLCTPVASTAISGPFGARSCCETRAHQGGVWRGDIAMSKCHHCSGVIDSGRRGRVSAGWVGRFL